MPQKLFNVVKQGPYQHMFGPDWVLQSPQLSALIFNAISIWSYLEAVSIPRLLSIISGASSLTALSIYEALNSDATKQAVLQAVAKTHVTDKKYDLLRAILHNIKEQAQTRHKLVHWIWGYSQDLPDHLLLISPKQFAAGKPDSIQGLAFSGPLPGKWDKYFRNIEVYVQHDIEEIITRFTRTLQSVEQFSLLWKPQFPEKAKDEIFDRLSNEPEFKAILNRPK